MNAYKLIDLGFVVVAGNDTEIILSKTYKNGNKFLVSCDTVTTAINQVFKR